MTENRRRNEIRWSNRLIRDEVALVSQLFSSINRSCVFSCRKKRKKKEKKKEKKMRAMVRRDWNGVTIGNREQK